MVEYKQQSEPEEDDIGSDTELQGGSFFSQNPFTQFDGAVHTNKFGHITAECKLNETVPQLTQLLHNEKMSPELLPYQFKLVQDVAMAIRKQEHFINESQ